MNRTPCSVARHFFETVWIAGDLSVIETMISEDYVEHLLVPAPGMTPDRAGLRRAIEGVRRALPDLKVIVEDMIAQGDRVGLRWRLSGTRPDTGDGILVTGIRWFRVEGERIVEGWNAFDAAPLRGLLNPHIALVRGIYDAFLRGDIEGILASLSDDVVWINPAVRAITGTESYRGKEGAMAFFQALGGHTELRRFEIAGISEDALGVVATGIWEALVPATGKVASSEWLMRWKIEESQVVSYRALLEATEVDAAFAL